MKNQLRTRARLFARQAAFRDVEARNEKYSGKLGDRPGFKHPGSNKKPFPAGRGKAHR